jgi:hypothetical protein
MADEAKVIPISEATEEQKRQAVLQPRVKKLKEIFESVGQLQVKTDSDYLLACALAKKLKIVAKELSQLIDPVVERAHAIHKKSVAERKATIGPCEQGEKLLKVYMINYALSTQERQKKLQQELDAAGSVAIVPSFLPKVEGVSYANNKDFEVVQESKVPRKFMTPDPRKIRAAIASGEKLIDGI